MVSSSSNLDRQPQYVANNPSLFSLSKTRVIPTLHLIIIRLMTYTCLPVSARERRSIVAYLCRTKIPASIVSMATRYAIAIRISVLVAAPQHNISVITQWVATGLENNFHRSHTSNLRLPNITLKGVFPLCQLTAGLVQTSHFPSDLDAHP